MAFRREDVVTVTEYELRLTCRVVLRERGVQQPILDQPVSGRTALLVGPDQTALNARPPRCWRTTWPGEPSF
jgi:hypothetical protein